MEFYPCESTPSQELGVGMTRGLAVLSQTMFGSIREKENQPQNASSYCGWLQNPAPVDGKQHPSSFIWGFNHPFGVPHFAPQLQ